ncbi:MAG: carbamoyl-phosphate synthase domain-containing protein, partial [Pseudomonadota bacterium]
MSRSGPIPALLALEDGRVFRGQSVGAEGSALGEVVFNTSMTGYQEILTDPSYCHQLVTLTVPHIGNVGANREDEEAAAIHAGGLIVRDLPRVASNWRAESPLSDYLSARNVVALAGIDTRALTRHLRNEGAKRGCIATGNALTPEQAIAEAKAFPGLVGADLAKVVSTDRSYPWREGVWTLDAGYNPAPPPAQSPFR